MPTMVIFGLLFLLILGIMTFSSSHSHLISLNQEEMPQDEPFKTPSKEPFRSSPDDIPFESSAFRLTGKEAFLKRQMLKNTSVTCNDGTTAGYYLRRSPGSKKWIIFLEGGGLCFSPLSCQQRWKVTRFFMTSAHWPQIKSMGGILSLNQEENPFWYRANHVLIPYCSSDSWTGNHRARNPGEFSFLGSRIIEQVILELLPQGLHESDLMVLAGESAGAVGVLTNLDRVSELMALVGSRTQVRGLADSGWFLDNKPFEFNRDGRTSGSKSNLCHTSPHNCPPVEGIKLGIRLWNGQVPTSCAAQYPSEPWRCYFGYRIYPTLRTPIFIVQWIFDQAQMQVDNVANPVMKAQWSYIHNLGIEMKKSLENVTALFAPSCIAHSIISKRTWTQIKVNQVTLPEALRCWELESTERSALRRKHLLITGASALSNGAAVSDVRFHNKLSSIGTTSKSGDTINDNNNNNNYDTNIENIMNGRANRETNNNNNNSSSRESISSLSISGALQHNVNTDVNNISERNNNVSDRGNINLQANQGNDLIQSDETPLLVSSNNPQVHFSFPPSFVQSPSSDLSKHTHIELIEEKDVTSTTTKRPTTTSLPMSDATETSLMTFVVGSNRRRKRKRKHRHRNNHNFNKRSKFPYGKYCRYHYIDNCSLPQCNHGCPKYYNPLTGKEMDFHELFKSLGLNMTMVAESLGMEPLTDRLDPVVSLHKLLPPD